MIEPSILIGIILNLLDIFNVKVDLIEIASDSQRVFLADPVKDSLELFSGVW